MRRTRREELLEACQRVLEPLDDIGVLLEPTASVLFCELGGDGGQAVEEFEQGVAADRLS